MAVIGSNFIPPPKLVKRPWGLFVDEATFLDLDGAGATQEPSNGPTPEGPEDADTDDVSRRVRWRDGVTFAPYGCEGLISGDMDACDEDVWIHSTLPDDCPHFDAFAIYGDEDASTLYYDYEDIQDRMNDRFAVMASEQLAARFLATVVHDNVTVLGPSPCPFDFALAAVESALAHRLHGAQGTICATPAIFTLMVKSHLQFFDGHYFSPNGHIVISDAGFAQLTDDGDPADEFLIGCGPIVYQLGPPQFTEQTAVEYLDQPRNRITGRILANAVVAADPCSVVGIQVEYPTSFTGS